MRTTWTFHTPGKLIFGRGAVRQLGEIVTQLKSCRVLVVTDKPLVVAGVADAIRQPLAAAGAAVEVFDGGEPEPPISAVNAVIAMARDRPEHLPGMAEKAFAVKRVLRVNPRTASQDELADILRSAL